MFLFTELCSVGLNKRLPLLCDLMQQMPLGSILDLMEKCNVIKPLGFCWHRGCFSPPLRIRGTWSHNEKERIFQDNPPGYSQYLVAGRYRFVFPGQILQFLEGIVKACLCWHLMSIRTINTEMGWFTQPSQMMAHQRHWLLRVELFL